MSTSDTTAPVLVTGATGFLGSHVCRSLIAAGLPVRALCRDPDSPAAQRLPPECSKISGDVLDPGSLSAALDGCTQLYHCAGKVSRDRADSSVMHRVHVEGTQHTLDAGRVAGVKTAVVASTSGTIAWTADPEQVADESHAADADLIAQHPYYRSKLYAERGALAMDSEAMRVVVVNPSLLLGPGDLHLSSSSDVRRYIARPMPIVPGGGLSYVDVRDVAQAMLIAAERGRGGVRYLLTASNCSVRVFFARIAEIAGVRAPVGALPRSAGARKLSRWLVDRVDATLGRNEDRPDGDTIELAQYNWYVDASRAERELAWNPRDAMETLADTIADLHMRGVVEVPALSEAAQRR